ncbi:MAG: peptidoglycan DD-metalloendopeptidase family protein [Dysgonamonadaceae bacterium]|nr:peptidoglycan DD-metalloendopeptidase family protein [Dysgonamonadaceae bacterium]
MTKILEKLTFLCLISMFPALSVVGQSEAIKKIEQSPLIKDLSEMIADKATLKRDLVIVDSIMLLKQLVEEDFNNEFPADDLYETWDTQFINPYKNISVPDSFRVDVSAFCMPFEGKITSPFGYRKRRFHYGTDIKLQTGDTVRAAFDGKVRIQSYQRRGYGYYMLIRHSNGLETVYGHLSKFLIGPEDTVKAGDPIALGGNTGRSTGSHLHFEIRFLGNAINPQEIVDFDHFSTFDDYYLFVKGKSGKGNKYVAGNQGTVYHRIKSGDTLGKIAKKYGVSINQLCRLNNIKSTTTLRVGRTLRCS